MEIRLLGRFDVLVQGTEVPLGGHRQRAVLAVLTVHANEILSVDRLIDEVWGGEPPASATSTLQRYVSHLRRALEGLPAAIETRRPGYVLHVDNERIDARRFERMVEEGRRLLSSGEVEPAASLLRDALALWRGQPLADFSYESFAHLETIRLEELRLMAVELRIDADLALGRHHDLVPELETLVATHPLRESYRGQLMRALHGTGRRVDALRVYSDGRRVLVNELGLDPSSGLQRLERAIILEDPAIEPEQLRPAGRVGKLPAELTSFVGRATEVQWVTDRLQTCRLVTLTGVGGSGKSRLALRIATELAPSFAGGAWLVELAGITDPAAVPRAFGQVLGVRDDAERDVVEAVLEALQQQPSLVVVDGCEHLLDAVAPLVERILANTVDVRVMATSREVLGVPGEVAFRVPTMPDQDAVDLFVERAGSVDASFRLDDADAAVVTDVCRRLDGIPLALELAAARMDVLTPRQLADRLDRRFELLGDDRRSALPRHRTLRATIDWSYALLDEPERLLFERLAVFAGSFTVDTAEAVCADDGLSSGDVVGVLTRLVRKSLVVRVDSSGPVARYRLLDTLREYARDCLSDRGDAAAVFGRHVAYFTDMAERLGPAVRGPGSARLLEELENEVVEFPAALTWLLDQGDGEGACRLATALVPYWDSRFRLGEALEWLRRSIAVDADTPTTRPRLWAQVGVAYFSFMAAYFGGTGDSQSVLAECDKALEWLAVLPDPLARAKIATIRGDIARNEDDLDLAGEATQEAIALCRQCGDAWSEADAFRILVLLEMDRGNIERATAGAAECLRLYQSSGDIEKMAGAQVLLGSLARDRGQFGRAAELYEQSLGGFQQVGEQLGAGFSLWLLSEVASMQGDAEVATRFAEECLRIYEEIGYRRGISHAHRLLALAALVAGDLETADRRFIFAFERFRERGYSRDVLFVVETGAYIRFRKGEFEEAARLAQDALEQARTLGYGGFVPRYLVLLASARARLGHVEEAKAVAEEAIAVADRMGDIRARARGLTALAEAAVADGRPEDALTCLDRARKTLVDADAEFTVLEAEDFDRVHAAASQQLPST